MSLSCNSSSKLTEFVFEQMDEPRYYALYPDVAADGMSSGIHWLKHGFREGREFPNFEYLVLNDDRFAARFTQNHWNWFAHDTQYVAIRKKISASQKVIEKILKQSYLEPAVLSAGNKAINNLKVFHATDLLYRTGIDIHQLYSSLELTPDAVILVPSLTTGDVEKYSADLFRSLRNNGINNILIIATEQSRESAGEWQQLEVFKDIEPTSILFWRDSAAQNLAENPITFARFLASLNCPHIFVINSALGLRTVSNFGRGLSQNSRIYCEFFNVGINCPGAYHAAYYPRKIAAFATCVTNNVIMAQHLAGLYGSILANGITVLSPMTETSRPLDFTRKLRTRLSRLNTQPKQKHWCYIGRLSLDRGLEVIGRLAEMRPDDMFHLFGSLEVSVEELGIVADNIQINASIKPTSKSDLSAFDGFIFPSRFEDMPNIVLEMSQQAIPILTTDIGGLKGTFGDNSIFFVTDSDDVTQAAEEFDRCMNSVAEMSRLKLLCRIMRAQHRVARLHSSKHHAAIVGRLLNGMPL